MTYQPTQLARKALAFPTIFLLSFTAPILAQSPPELSFTDATLSSEWVQVGADIDGEAVNDSSGSSVSLSADGRTVAIGATGNRNGAGHTRIFQQNDLTNKWEQLGSDIDGEANFHGSGFSVSLSADGLSVAIGAPSNERNGSGSGRTRIFRYIELTSQWEQLGDDIDGEATGDGSGNSVSLSADGLSVAIGAARNDGNGSWSGHTRIYRYDEVSSQWEQFGSDIDGEAVNDLSGSSVSLSADGLSVAIGAPGNDGNGGTSGHTRIYRYDEMSSQWEQFGSDIGGEAVNDSSGSSVSLSADGRTVAIGATGNRNGAGHTRIFQQNDLTNKWEQLGSDIDGEAAGDYSGGSVSLSADGLSVAIGAARNDGNGSRSGHTRIYRYNELSLQWEQVGADLDGEDSWDASGESVSLSADGLSIAIGASENEGNGSGSGPFRTNPGHTRIYRFKSPLTYRILENTTTITDVMSIDNADLEGAGLVYSLSGADAALFTISNSGELEFVNAPDYEVPTDVGGDNIYDLVVTVTDSDGLSDSQVLAISVDEVPFVITESDFDLSGQQVTLSWISVSGKSYRVRYSPDLEDWDTVIGAGVDVEQDENPANPNELTMTFDLSGLIPVGAAKAFFRIEEEP